ncbi:hypothetical protein F5Y18DRAFT_11217 [Xylariaceae sp. FL1019]|nr:hypothetical protein F5Y18DRAFT_11217 [Xylariaceae sp. FL1019]
MDTFSKLKRRGTNLMNSIPQNMPQMPKVQMPSQMPSMPSMPLMPHFGGGHGLKGTWEHIPLPQLPRSSHSLDVVAGNAYIFGGEMRDGHAVDNDMHVVVLPSSGANADYYAVKAKPSPDTAEPEKIPSSIAEDDETGLRDPLTDVSLSPPAPATPSSSSEASPLVGKGKGPETRDVPSGRIGHATAVIGTRIFLFGGRSSGAESSTLDERGRVWIFETKTHTWTYLDPHHTSPIPPARSYHAAVATDKPRDFSGIKPIRMRRSSTWKEWAEGDSAEVGIPQRPIAGHIAESAIDDEASGAGFGTFIIHGGCLADGSRTADIWSFDVHAYTWKQLPDAPSPARGGACLAMAKSRLYRFGGFDGTTELGGQLDVLELGLDEFNDQSTIGEIGIVARGSWHSIVAPYTPETTGTETKPWPAPRSVSNLSLVHAGGGREYLVLSLGQSSPAAEDAKTGSFHSDVWAFQVPPLGGTTASVTDAFSQIVGKKTGEGTWTSVNVGPYDDEEKMDVRGPGPRGWFAAAPLTDLEENGVFIFGGIAENGARLGDGWIFRLG